MTQRHLYISDIAQLVGVSVKTVRHYHKLGLLPEPSRSESGYRLYRAGHVKRLHLIRQMRAIGLSLPQIRTVIQAADEGCSLRMMLQELLDETDEQLHELQERRVRIDALLANAELSFEDLNDSPSLFLASTQASVEQLLPELDERLLAQEAQIDAVLSAYQWSEDLPEQAQALLRYIQANPHSYLAYVQELQTIWRQLAEPLDETDLSDLADDFVLRHRAMFGRLQRLTQEANLPPHLKQVMRNLLGDVISPMQKRFTQELFSAYHRLNETSGEI
jgi:DNA-binding transcriptional MerR regulator